MAEVDISIIQIKKPKDFKINVIIGMSHFMKTVDDIYEAIANVSTDIKFGVAFCEASGDRRIMFEGTDEEMIRLAVSNAKQIGAGHSFVLFLNGTFPISIMHNLKTVPEITTIYCATSNPLQVIVGETKQGRGIMGVIDGGKPTKIESDEDKKSRKSILKQLGYKN